MKCLYCIVNKKENPEIDRSLADYKVVAIEKPPKLVFFHSECLEKIEDILIFLTKNKEIWYN